MQNLYHQPWQPGRAGPGQEPQPDEIGHAGPALGPRCCLKESMPGVQEGRVHDKLQCIGLRCSWNRIP